MEEKVDLCLVASPCRSADKPCRSIGSTLANRHKPRPQASPALFSLPLIRARLGNAAVESC